MKVFLLILITISFFACSSNKCVKENNDYIQVNSFECWLNLMPGGKPTFHYSGMLEIKKSGIENFVLNELEFFSNEKSIYKSKPIYELNQNYNSSNEQKLIYNFFAPQNLYVSDDLMKTNSLDVKIYFSVNKKSKDLTLKNIELQRAY